MLLLSVPQILRPGLPCERAALLFTGIASMDFLVPFYFTREAESHVTAFERALVRRDFGVLFTHVGPQLLVLLELESAAFVGADVFPGLLAVEAAHVSETVGVGLERLRTTVDGAGERLVSAVDQLVSRQMIRAAEGLTAVLVSTRVRLHSRVFTKVGVQLPLFVVGGGAALERAEVAFVLLRFTLHFSIIDSSTRGITGLRKRHHVFEIGRAHV